MTIDTLPDEALLEIFSFYLVEVSKPQRAMAYPCSCLPKMAKHYLCIAMSPKSMNFLHTQETSKRDIGHMAKPPHTHIGL